MFALANLRRVKNITAFTKHVRCLSLTVRPEALASRVTAGAKKNDLLPCAGFHHSRALSGAVASSPIENVSASDKVMKVQWKNGKQAEFHGIWLRDHCLCKECLNPATNQREVDVLRIPLDIAPEKVKVAGDAVQLTWPDGHSTVYDGSWLAEHAYGREVKSEKHSDICLWDNKRITSASLPNFSFEAVVSDEKDLFRLSHAIIKYGFAFVNETPTDLSAMEQMADRLGGFVRVTHYGKLWSFSNEAMDHADTAYTSAFLHAHTDNTYYSSPAGLQMLHCINHNGEGGESLLVDGFNAAEQLRQKNPEAFEFLSTKVLPYRYIDDVRHLKANGPTIELHPFTKELMQIRYNHYDRAIIDCLDPEEIPKYYEAIQAYAAILRDLESEYWFKLVPGKLMIMGNWRVMHGRSGFTGRRDMQGCYAEKDYFFGQYWPLLKKYQNSIDV